MTDPASSILEQAHRELAKVRDIDARILVYRQLVSDLVAEGAFLVDRRNRIRAEAAAMRQDAIEIRRAERRPGAGRMVGNG